MVFGGVYLVGPGPGLFGFVLACSVMVLAGIGVCGVGLSLAWRMSSVSGFHGVMNGVLLPMWALSGALFPAGASAGWVSLLMGVNPLAWAHRSAAGALGVGPAASWWEPLGVATFAVVALAGAVMTMDRRVG